ncbi:MAG: transporter substrate-binding domain-containing protein [Bacteroidales bacterium]|nr:transporter substrate-binding domain-containing protein [Bacteroidales bacterium]
MKRILIYFILTYLMSYSCEFYEGKEILAVFEKDFEDIREKGKITVLTDYSSTDYYIYRGQPMGYQYEMLQNLAEYLGVRLEVRVNRDLEESFELLQKGEVDLIARNLTVTRERKKEVDFTVPLIQTRQVLVQRKPDNWKQMTTDEIQSMIISNPVDLAGKSIHVLRGSAYVQRLYNLSEEIGDSIHILEVDESIEQLIELTAEGEISYTVCDEIFAQVNAGYYPEIDISTGISLQQNMAWAVRKGSARLLDELNAWLDGFLQSGRYRTIYSKYFIREKPSALVESDYYAINSGRISPFDDYIRQYSEVVGWDWRLLTSLIYQESRFKVSAVSWAGAFGLMQLMPATARQFGVIPESSPKEQIQAGIEFIKWLDDQYQDIADPVERKKFVLAAYNVGRGHVEDARRLARKNGVNPDVWDNSVDQFLLSKSDPEFYNDPVVKYGYCRGIETYRYVTEVLERYEHYRNVVPD